MTDVLIVIVLFAWWWGGTLVLALKGKYWWAGFHLLLIGLWLFAIPMCRLAKPGSWWARRFYDDAKLRAARERFNPLR